MKRVMIVGGPGSGKSTLARKLAMRTDLPVFHMDHIHWKSGWQERPANEKIRLAKEVHQQPYWIFEGNHSSTYADRIARADTLIWLDFPVLLRLWRVLRRSVRYYGRSRPDLPEGCPERLNWQSVGFLHYIIRTRRTARAKLADIAQSPPPHLKVIQLTSIAEIDAFLKKTS